MSFLVHRDLHPLLVSVVASTYLWADVGLVVGLVFILGLCFFSSDLYIYF